MRVRITMAKNDWVGCNQQSTIKFFIGYYLRIGKIKKSFPIRHPEIY